MAALTQDDMDDIVNENMAIDDGGHQEADNQNNQDNHDNQEAEADLANNQDNPEAGVQGPQPAPLNAAVMFKPTEPPFLAKFDRKSLI